jgi:hypothetical protein
MRLLLAIVILLITGCKQTSTQSSLEKYLKANLPGWMIVDTADYNKLWWSFYDRTQAHNAITVDLNDDRIADHALLMKKGSDLRLVVLLGSANKSYSHWIADDFHPEYDGAVKEIHYGLTVEPPAQIDVLEPEERSLVLQSNAVTLLEMEQRARVYHWENGTIKTLYAK